MDDGDARLDVGFERDVTQFQFVLAEEDAPLNQLIDADIPL